MCASGSFNPKGSLAQGVEVNLNDSQSSTAASSKPPLNLKQKSKSSNELTTPDSRLSDSAAPSSVNSVMRTAGDNSKSGTPSQSAMSSNRSLESRDSVRSSSVNGGAPNSRASQSLTSQQKVPVNATTSKSMSSQVDDGQSRSREGKPATAAAAPKFYYNVVELLEKGKTMS